MNKKKINSGFDFLEEMVFANIELEKQLKKLKKHFTQKQLDKIIEDHSIKSFSPKALPLKYKKSAGEEYYFLVQEEFALDQFNNFCNSNHIDLNKLEQDLLIVQKLIDIKNKKKK